MYKLLTPENPHLDYFSLPELSQTASTCVYRQTEVSVPSPEEPPPPASLILF